MERDLPRHVKQRNPRPHIQDGPEWDRKAAAFFAALLERLKLWYAQAGEVSLLLQGLAGILIRGLGKPANRGRDQVENESTEKEQLGAVPCLVVLKLMEAGGEGQWERGCKG